MPAAFVCWINRTCCASCAASNVGAARLDATAWTIGRDRTMTEPTPQRGRWYWLAAGVGRPGPGGTSTPGPTAKTPQTPFPRLWAGVPAMTEMQRGDDGPGQVRERQKQAQ